eukprot:CAMPEP_0172908330 /NCGR_PEP_ID=MMETSP1075-20121228/180491_1 /TAXON_ID=2916 /ORGANISM="Ceratium fusus, Strain PA161109" /LENGTH=504 /DNA_ID=CAMNT_0013766077 /DNA_START=217 /DNA_END=1731 /DNA_ORIENTATION=-
MEYKYVICDNHGQQARWEEGANRCIHLAALVANGVVSDGICAILVRETFNSNDGESDESRFCTLNSATPLRRAFSPALKPCASKESATSKVWVAEQPIVAEGEERPEFFEPTVRLRRNSTSLVSSLAGSRPSGLQLASKSLLTDPSAEASVHCLTGGYQLHHIVTENQAEADPTTSGLVREESYSNLFVGNDANDEDLGTAEFDDRYILAGNGPLGEGTFGLVWRCIPKQLGKERATASDERAAKIVRKARLAPRDLGYLLGVDGEIQIHLAMKHPHIIELHEYFDEANSVTLVLEYCRGGDLFDAIVRRCKLRPVGDSQQPRGLPEPAAALAASHVISALTYLHGLCVVHRDIKCENVLLAHADLPVEQNVFKLCDFGFAARDRGGGLTDRLGSPDTVAPEVVLGKAYGRPADLWSVGVLIYMMLSARPPFFAPTDTEVLKRVRAGVYDLTGGDWNVVSMPAKDMISGLMAVDAKLRPTALEALGADWLRLSGVPLPSGVESS